MKNIGILLNCTGIGDIISSIPTIKFLYKLYNKKIYVFNKNLEIFKNYPYIINKEINNEELNKIRESSDWKLFTTFDINRNIHPRIDIRQFHASNLGLQLLPEELNIEFYPDKYEDINLPNNYVVVHPVKTWPSRTWEEQKWQKLINVLNENNIPVIAVGKKSSEIGTYNTQKPIFNINIEKGMNLLDKLSLHQIWHILNKATVVITMDSGILHLAGTTDTAIVQLGSSINPKFRIPYRNDTQDYKYTYVQGECKLLCASNVKYNIKYNGEFNRIAPITFCLERPESIGIQDFDPEIYKCHPTVNDVVIHTMKMYNMYKTDELKENILIENKGNFYL